MLRRLRNSQQKRQRGGQPLFRSAVIDDPYRYQLTRTWSRKKPQLSFLLFAPSNIDPMTEDSLIRRCMRVARDNGYGSCMIVSLFGHCVSHPSQIRKMERPFGPDNLYYIRVAMRNHMVCGWGQPGHLHHRHIIRVLNKLKPQRPMFYLGATVKGHPVHPLSVPKRSPLARFRIKSWDSEGVITHMSTGATHEE